MSVKQIRAHIEAASNQLHEAQIEFKNTPARFKYLEISQLMVKLDELKVRLDALQIDARLVHRQVLKREGKNPDYA